MGDSIRDKIYEEEMASLKSDMGFFKKRKYKRDETMQAEIEEEAVKNTQRRISSMVMSSMASNADRQSRVDAACGFKRF